MRVLHVITLVVAMLLAPSCGGGTGAGGTGEGSATSRIDIDAPALSSELRQSIERAANSALTRAEKSMQHEVGRRVLVRCRARVDDYHGDDRVAFRSWTVAYARPERAELVLALDRLRPDPPDDLESVLVHEMVHVVLGDLERESVDDTRAVPRWLHEGLAQVAAGSRYLGGGDEALWYRAKTDQLMSLSSLTSGFPNDDELLRVAYAQSSSFLSWLDARVGRDRILAALRSWLHGDAINLDAALASLDPEWSFTLAEGLWAEDLKTSSLLALLRNSCFNVLILLALPLLAIILYKRFRREQRAGARLDRWEADEERRRLARIAIARQRLEADRLDIEFVDSDPFTDVETAQDDV
ncbi:MAG: hypothetical protein KDC95_19640 [Planctomycetes bacterium]|nr:hypothetical protein [Planctomycetota bacterium]